MKRPDLRRPFSQPKIASVRPTTCRRPLVTRFTCHYSAETSRYASNSNRREVSPGRHRDSGDYVPSGSPSQASPPLMESMRLLDGLRQQHLELMASLESMRGLLGAVENIVGADDTLLSPSDVLRQPVPTSTASSRALSPEALEALRTLLKQGRRLTESMHLVTQSSSSVLQGAVDLTSLPEPPPAPATPAPPGVYSGPRKPSLPSLSEFRRAESSLDDDTYSPDATGRATRVPSPAPSLVGAEELARDEVAVAPGLVCTNSVTVGRTPGLPLGRPDREGDLVITSTLRARVQDEARPLLERLSGDEVVALVAQALVPAAHRVVERLDARAKSRDFPPNDAATELHRDVLRILSEGRVTHIKRRNVSEYGHLSFVVEMQDRHSARTIEALFKPRDPNSNDFDGWHRTPMESVAYHLNILLGLDLVPPAAYRRAQGGRPIELDGERFEEGVFVYYAQNCRPLHHVPREQWGVGQDQLLSDTRVLDVLLQNSDRHLGHFLMGESWCRGQRDHSGWRGVMQPILIDHAASFRHGAWVSMDHENAYQSGPVRNISARTYTRLKFLDRASLAPLRSALSEQELDDLMRRRDSILQYIDWLVHEQGLGRTIIDGWGPYAHERQGSAQGSLHHV